MKRYWEIDPLPVRVIKKDVLDRLKCFEDNPVYEEFSDEYDEIEEQIGQLVSPKGMIMEGVLPRELSSGHYPEGTRVLYSFLTVGGNLSQKSTEAFGSGDYVRGMLYDGMADSGLFSLEEPLMEALKKICAELSAGISARLEAPLEVPMSLQRYVWKEAELEKRYGVTISSGDMFQPVKSSCQVFVLTKNPSVFHAEHDCSSCDNLTCPMRKTKTPAESQNLKEGMEFVICPNDKAFLSEKSEGRILVGPGESVMDALIREKIPVQAACGGNGFCGKCGVRVVSGKADIQNADRKIFSEDRQREGWRLSCLLYPKEEMTVWVPAAGEEGFEVLAGTGNRAASPLKKSDQTDLRQNEVCTAAVDIGTTTIAVRIQNDKGEILSEGTGLNSQRQFGADVISRIQASVNQKGELLRTLVREDLTKILSAACQDAGLSPEDLKEIRIAGNTTMEHLFLGLDCSTLGVYPFTPVNLKTVYGKAEELIGKNFPNAAVTVLPGISTYVGADIAAGIAACGMDQSDEICMLIDLGTNGEMAIGNRDRILAASTAAGPAFEGGNISCGTGSIPGAIRSVQMDEDGIHVQTIKDKDPVGICGTGVIETVSELYRTERMDETGLLEEEYFDDGILLGTGADGKEIRFTQQDVREIQLAKAAIRAGIETLLLRFGAQKEQVARVYLAGGFGFRLDCKKAVSIGMLPEEFSDKIVTAGNTSLEGAFLAADPAVLSRIEAIAETSKEISLSGDPDFSRLYMDGMMFGEE